VRLRRLSGNPLGGWGRGFMLRYDWIIFTAVSLIAVLEIRRRLGLQPVVAWRPLAIASAPWLLAGVVALQHPELDSFKRYDLNLGPPVYASIAAVVVVWITLVSWLFRGGAELLANSASVRRALHLPESPSTIKLLAIAAVCGGVLGMISIVITATLEPR
jgi:hypothetical protein